MSVTIDVKKLKFHVLGNGFDNVRNDSGFGAKSYVANVYAYGGMIDETNTYMWLCTGDGLKKYRIDVAKTLLTESNESRDDIAYKVGYTDTKYFAKVFRDVTGKTITEYIAENT